MLVKAEKARQPMFRPSLSARDLDERVDNLQELLSQHARRKHLRSPARGLATTPPDLSLATAMLYGLPANLDWAVERGAGIGTAWRRWSPLAIANHYATPEARASLMARVTASSGPEQASLFAGIDGPHALELDPQADLVDGFVH